MKTKFADQPLLIRTRMLRDSADKIEEKGYMKSLTGEDMTSLKDQITDVSIQISEANEEKKTFLAEHKEHLKPLANQLKDLLSQAKQKSIYVKEELSVFLEHDAGVAEYYNSAGEMVDCRPLRPDERQSTIFMAVNDSFERTGTHN